MEEIKNDLELVASMFLIMVDLVVYKLGFNACSIFLLYLHNVLSHRILK